MSIFVRIGIAASMPGVSTKTVRRWEEMNEELNDSG
ncbi:MAG: MerR family transcriptional regulator [Promethearchaeota archaeon]